jgi:3-deoxy-D-manno-octulosonic-acid transferase
MRFLYTCFFYLAIPFILLRLLWRAIAAPAYAKRWAERFGFFSSGVATPGIAIPGLSIHKSAADKKTIWVHTVSVGEFIAALPLIRQLQTRGDIQLVVTTTTPTGSERVRASLGDSVYHVYAPYDLPDVLARFINKFKPSLLLIMETELWPNTLAACAKRGIPSVLVNARMSERSARGYAKFSALTQPMLKSLSMALVQNKTDAARLNALGLPMANTQVTGSIKFDLTLSDDLRTQAEKLKQQWSNNGERLIWIAASTHQGEDEIILDAFAQCLKNPALTNLLLVLVPRHPERFKSVSSQCESRGFVLAKRSTDPITNVTQIVLGDTMGELLLFFGASDIAFVGGSLIASGGHNLIEPAAWQLPLLSGEHVFNFAEVAQLLQNAGGLVLVNSSEALAKQVELLSLDAEERQKRGLAALTVANENRGALQKTLDIIDNILR